MGGKGAYSALTIPYTSSSYTTSISIAATTLLLALKLPAYSMLTLHFALPKSHIHSDSPLLWFQDVLPKGITPDCQCIALNPIFMGEFGDLERSALL